MSKNYALDSAGYAVAASATEKVVSQPFGFKDPWYVSAKVVLKDVSETTGVSFKLKDSYDDGGSYYDVGDQSALTLTKKTFVGGTGEVTVVTFPDFATAAQADYVGFETTGAVKYAFWIDKDANGTVPTGAVYVAATNKVRIPSVTGNTATALAALAVTAIGTIANVTIVDNLDGTVTFTQQVGGACVDAAPHNTGDTGAGTIAVSVTTAGSNGTALVLATDRITISTHGFLTGDPVIFKVGTAVPTGLTSGTTYYVIKVDANTLKLATTNALALAGTAIDITGYGNGTHALYAAHYEIRMYREDATDAAQLPVWEDVVLTCTTGAGDSVSISGVWLADK